MDNIPITQVEGDLPTYMELQTVAVPVDNCIINNENENDYDYDTTKQQVESNEYDEGDLSAEEINTMIMINEGKDAVNETEEKKTMVKSKKNIPMRRTSDIKSLLTHDLPKTEKFLSTSSLKRLTALPKQKKRRYSSDYECEDVLNSKNKKKKEAEVKETKTTKGTKIVKLLEKKAKFLGKQNKTLDKQRLKKLKKLQENPEISGKKIKKLISGKKKADLDPKKRPGRPKKDDGDKSENEKEEPKKKKVEPVKNGKKEVKEEEEKPPPPVITSRSGRIRKIKDVSDFVSNSREARILKPVLNLAKSENKKKLEDEIKNSFKAEVKKKNSIKPESEKNEVEEKLDNPDSVENASKDESSLDSTVETKNKGKKKKSEPEDSNDREEKPEKSRKNPKNQFNFSKKKRRTRHVDIRKTLKNYGEEIDFSQRIEDDVDDSSQTGEETANSAESADENIDINSNSSSNDSTASKKEEKRKRANLKAFELKLKDIMSEPIDSEIFECVNNIRELFSKNPQSDRFRRCHSAGVVHSFKKEKSSQKSLEMPEVLPSRIKDLGIKTKPCLVSLKHIDEEIFKKYHSSYVEVDETQVTKNYFESKDQARENHDFQLGSLSKSIPLKKRGKRVDKIREKSKDNSNKENGPTEDKKESRGRPRKESIKPEENMSQDGSEPTEETPATKDGRGRPRKESIKPENSTSEQAEANGPAEETTKGRGRPRIKPEKNTEISTTEKITVPETNGTTEEASAKKDGRGRPRKNSVKPPETSDKLPRGKPRKNSVAPKEEKLESEKNSKPRKSTVAPKEEKSEREDNAKPRATRSRSKSRDTIIPSEEKPGSEPKETKSAQEAKATDSESEKKQFPDRRRSFREIKLTPKLADMIATSSKRPRKLSQVRASNEDLNAVATASEQHQKEGTAKENDSAYSNLIKRVTADSPVKVKAEAVLEEPNPAIENYLQSKIEALAENFECPWQPGDLVWSRLTNSPYWPSIVLGDPFFENEEHSQVKCIGRTPRLHVHVQFLADQGRRSWLPDFYLMNYEGLESYNKQKSNLPSLKGGPKPSRRERQARQAYFIQKKDEANWMESIKEAEALASKNRDERITYMKIKYPLVKYAVYVENGRLVPNEKKSEGKSPRKRKRTEESVNASPSSTESKVKNEHVPDKAESTSKPKEIFECITVSDSENAEQKPITLKIVRSPKKDEKRKSRKSTDSGESKPKKVKKEPVEKIEEENPPSDSGSNAEKSSEASGSSFKFKKYQLFKGAKPEKVCLKCYNGSENEKVLKCKGACQGFFHASCASNIKEETKEKSPKKNKSKKKLFPKEEPKSEAEEPKEIPKEETEEAEKDFYCDFCMRKENPCFVCNSASGNRQKCGSACCGKFYHQQCLKYYPQTTYNQGAPNKKHVQQSQDKIPNAESPSNLQILSCPNHICHTCNAENLAGTKSKYLYDKLVKCVQCPTAYHVGNYCVPAGSRILSTTQIICGKHLDSAAKRNHVNIAWCFICNQGGSLICCELCPSSFHLTCLNMTPPDGPYICEECEAGRFPLYGEVVWVKLGRYRWWPAKVLFPQETPDNILAISHKTFEFAVRFYGSNDYYWLHRGRVFIFQEGDSQQNFKGQKQVDKLYQKAVQEAAADFFIFQEERKKKYSAAQNNTLVKPPPYVKIKTNKPIGKVQLCDPERVEQPVCECDPDSDDPCSFTSDCLNRMLLIECNPNACKAKERCKNQSFEKKEYPKLEPYRTEHRGWGLKTNVDISKGQFVIEYVGEVIDEEEFKKRMKRKHETKDSNYYFLTIDKDRIIDAGPKGNLARFMNHSCSPNCETQKWTVNGGTRVGLFAMCDIPAGTELTFNYNLDCIGNEKKVCKCGGENCSGFIGIKATKATVEKTEKSVEKSGSKSRNLRAREIKQYEDECFICEDGGELMVCDLKNCPKVYHLECLGLTDWPNEKWLCPRHKCCECNRSTKRNCRYCPTAYCSIHTEKHIFSDGEGFLYCKKHIDFTVKNNQTSRNTSVAKRHSPILEYEKPFAEKYRPPPKDERDEEPKEKENEILMEPNLMDNTPIFVDNPFLSCQINGLPSSSPDDAVSVQVVYIDEDGQIVSVEENPSDVLDADEIASMLQEEKPTPPVPPRKKRRTNLPRRKIYPDWKDDRKPKTEPQEKISPAKTTETQPEIPLPPPPPVTGIDFEPLLMQNVEENVSKLNMDSILNIIGVKENSPAPELEPAAEPEPMNESENQSDAMCNENVSVPEINNSCENETLSDGVCENEKKDEEKSKDDENDLKTENKNEETEVDRSRRSKYFKIGTPEKFSNTKSSPTKNKVVSPTESESNQKTVTDTNYIEFMHPLRSSRSRTKTNENSLK